MHNTGTLTPDETRPPSSVTVAAWAFCASFFFVEIAHDSAPLVSLKALAALEMVVMLGLFVLVVVGRPSVFQRFRRQVSIMCLVLWALLLSGALYTLLLHGQPILGPSSIYIERSARLGIFLVSTLVYALFFFDRDVLLRVFWRIGMWVIAVCVVSVVLWYAMESRYLLNFRADTVRVQAFFSEPSALAPFIPVMAILAIRRRRWFVAFLALALVLLAKSPTVLVVTSVSVPCYFLLIRGNRIAKIGAVALLAGFFAFSINAVTLDPYALAASNSSPRLVVSRLIFGLNAVRSGGDLGHNTRFDNTMETWRTLDAHDLLLTGYGLNSASAYFLARDGVARDNSLALTVLFSYGVGGLALFAIAATVATNRIVRDDPAFAALVLPFLVASLLNSAGGFVTYKFALLGITCALARWPPSPNAVCFHHPMIPVACKSAISVPNTSAISASSTVSAS